MALGSAWTSFLDDASNRGSSRWDLTDSKLAGESDILSPRVDETRATVEPPMESDTDLLLLYGILPDDPAPTEPTTRSTVKCGGGIQKAPRKRELTEKKVMQNRLAQKLFRERKNAHAKDLERRVAELEHRLKLEGGSYKPLEITRRLSVASSAEVSSEVTAAGLGNTMERAALMDTIGNMQDRVAHLEMENEFLRQCPTDSMFQAALNGLGAGSAHENGRGSNPLLLHLTSLMPIPPAEHRTHIAQQDLAGLNSLFLPQA
ncbi:hypothetical protein BC830DRAFT_1204226 [Chytriomyces sp. MP71]|nr:hypothetical protein BC830DRAFT_1204226 [Chytriomyces sp. MP71]